MNAGLAKALGVMIKLDFERPFQPLSRDRSKPRQAFSPVSFSATSLAPLSPQSGESEPTGDEKFFSLSRQPKCIPIIATQSISSLKSALPAIVGDSSSDIPHKDFPHVV